MKRRRSREQKRAECGRQGNTPGEHSGSAAQAKVLVRDMRRRYAVVGPALEWPAQPMGAV